VTSLTVGAAGFFSRSLVGCEKGQSSPEGVAGGVFVGVGVVAAADASERRLAEAVLPGGVPASFAAVGGVSGVHADHLPPSFMHFGCKDRAELCPVRVGNASVQPGLGPRPRWPGTLRGYPGRGGAWPGRARRRTTAPASTCGLRVGPRSSSPVLDLSVCTHRHVANTLEIHMACLGLEAPLVAVGGPFHVVVAGCGLETG